MAFHFKHWVFFIIVVFLIMVYLIYRAVSGKNHRTITDGKIDNRKNVVYWQNPALNDPDYNHSRFKIRGGSNKRKRKRSL